LKSFFSYWLVKINAMKKSAKILRCPHSKSFPPISKQKISVLYSVHVYWSVQFLHILQFGGYGVEVGKHKTCRPPKYVVVKIGFSVGI
jgi:hypothetical protein